LWLLLLLPLLWGKKGKGKGKEAKSISNLEALNSVRARGVQI